MVAKIISRRLLVTVIVLGLVFFVAHIFYFIPKCPLRSVLGIRITSTDTARDQEKTTFGLPIRLKIPRIKVDAPVDQVGLTSDWAMDVPKGPADVGWFKLGPYPGENGSAVIDGHYGWSNGRAAVFDNLSKLRAGDKIYVQDEKGALATFVVSSTRRYDSKEDASDVFGANDGKSHLNLVTCDGIWNKNQQNYSKRLVVFADKE